MTETVQQSRSSLLLLGGAHGTATAASGLGVLTPHAEAPVVAETLVGPVANKAGSVSRGAGKAFLLKDSTESLCICQTGVSVGTAGGICMPSRKVGWAPDLLQALKVITHLAVQTGRSHLGVAAVLMILLPVEEPVRDFEGARVGDDDHDGFELSS